MKLTKKIEAEIRSVYQAYWDSYLSGDIKTMGGFFSDDFTLIGTSDGEVFNNKKSAMKYLKATIDQVAGVLSKKNIDVKISKVDDTILVTEFFDAYVNTDNLPTFYGKFRATSVMKKVRGKWKIIHQHGSLPDSKAEDGETLATEKVKKENSELRDAVKRRTRELEQKNRELEIEASLEKVRARVMAMQSSSELADLIGVIHGEIARLDKNLDRSFIILFDDAGSSTWWMSDNKNLSLRRGYHLPFHKRAPYLACLQGWRKHKSVWTYVLKGAVKKKWDEFIFNQTELAQLPKMIKSLMAGAKVAYWSSSFNKYGCISTGSVKPLERSSFELMVRFSQMFEQTYTRFLDLQKAEAQTREAQIELSLERVRARAMAMQSSNELGALIGMIYTELLRLDSNLNRCFIVLFDDSGNSTWWMASTESTDLNRGYYVPYRDHPFNLACLDGWRSRDQTWRYILTGKGKKSWDAYIFGKTEMALVPQFIIENMRAFPTAYLEASFNKYGCVMAGATLSPIPLSSFDLIVKFSRTFEQTYTRFLDLQKAEAQARESQIQLALERVRARTMAMQHSDELQEAANLLFKQVQSLEIPVWSCGYNIWEKHEKVCTGWMSTNDAKQPPFRIPLTESPTFMRFYKSRKKNEDFYAEKVEGDALVAHYRYMFSLPDFAKIGEAQLKAGLTTLPESQINHVANFAHGNLIFITGESVPDAWDIFKRFAKVFEQTYTRFLDLKKAEAQAREAQIEAALEKVRSTSMGMHHSDELEKVVGILFDKLSELGLTFDGALICFFDKAKRDSKFWIATNHLSTPINIILPYDEEIAKNPIEKDFRSGKDILNKSYSGTVKNDYFRYTARHNEKIPESIRKFHLEQKAWTVTFAAEKNSLVGVDGWHGQTTSIENFQILKRFARVFEQAYVRFLDLQNAEAQAREAQIEAALEKVRSSSMSMHHSDELEKVVSVLFDKLSELGLSFDGALIYNFDKEKRNLQLWVASKLLSAPVKVNLPYTDEIAKNPIIEDLWRAIEKGEHVLNKSYSGKTKDDYFLYVAKNNENNVAQAVRDLQFQSYTISFAAEKNSVVGFDSWTGQLTSDQDFQVIRRFAGVFEQAYTRFLDLQRSEAQARESQIQLALERLRARTMAMHNSSELSEAASLMFEQLSQLGAALWICSFTICDKEKDVVEAWASPPNGKIMDPLYIPVSADPFQQRAYELWKNGGGVLIDHAEGIELQEGGEKLLAHPSMEKARKAVIESGVPIPTWVQQNAITYKHGFLLIVTTQPFEETQIFVRFAKVFEQTYTRFLDLKNAEALARESQIQLALERVRARTMAMQKSDELKEVAMLLFKQVADLGITCWTTGFNVWSEDGNSYLDYVTNPLGGIMEPYTVDTTRFAVIRDVSAARKKGETFYVRLETGDRQKETYSVLTEFGDKDQYGKILESGFQFPSQQVNHFVFGEKVSLLFVTYDHVPEAHDIFKRFGKAFELTFTRFLDLKKAEAQARESQIQLALERVRARTMAMQKSHELADVAELLFQQVSDLGIKTWTTGFNIWLNEDTAYEDWITNPQGGFIEPYIVDTTQFPIFIGTREAKQRGDEFLVQYVDGELIEETYKELTRIAPAQFQKLLQQGFKFPSQQYDHFVFGSKVSLMFITYEPVPEAHDIFKRFGKVFEQTYTRFLDLKKAEAQAREAHIETALEKVRARTMGMQRSDELSDAAILMFQQIRSFGLELWHCGISIWEKGENECTTWMSNPEGKLTLPTKLPLTEHPVFIKYDESRKNGIDFYAEEMSGKGLEEFFQYLKNLPVLGKGLREYIEEGGQVPTFQVSHVVNFAQGNLVFATYQACPEAHDIFKRFGKVFEQTYTRFLDLQTAEAQARESQIQLALERVRARTMAMQRSDELAEAAVLMFQQIKSFGLELWGCGFNIWEKDEKECMGWMSSPDGRIVPPVKIPLTEHPVFIEFYESRQKGIEFYTYERGGKELGEFYEYLVTVQEALKEYLDSGGSTPTFQIDHVVNFAHGNLIFITYEPCPDAHDIFKRFGKVFEQTYTRFLDLQNSEAQARESQIQLALERVRARTMAMQRSDELNDLAILLFQQVSQLGIKVWTTGFNDWSEDNNSYIDYITSPQGSLIEAFSIDVTEYPVFVEIANARKSGVEFWVQYLEGEMLKGTHAHLRKSGNKKYEKMVEEGFQFPSHQYNHFVFGSKVSVMFNTYEPVPEAHDIFIRFGKVFEQTYTRFLDLKNAEAQAREAQIEAALEKVRSGSLAMHHSDELEKVITVLFDKLLDLGLNIDGAAINIFDKGKRSSQAWVATKLLSAPVKVNLPYDDEMAKNAFIDDLWRALETGAHVFNRSYSGNAKDDYFRFIFKHNESKIPDATARFHLEATNWTVTWATAKNSILLSDSWSGKLTSEEDFQVLKRFSRVFDQAYTRFLDLQRAEAQAREAQIEAALERVRSRTMAMHKSEELLEVITVVSEQLQHVGIKFGTVSFGKNSSSFDMDFWVAAPDMKSPIKMYAPYTDIPIYNRLKEAYREGRNYFSDTFTAEETKIWNQHFIDHNPELFSEKSRGYLTSRPGMTRSTVLLKNVFLFLINYDIISYSNEEIEIVIRFANVFEQTYTRFLDLQKAEAQAREAQIEAALERLRSRTMAMQRSTELAEVSQLLHQQFLSLGVETITCAFMFPNEEKKTQSGWSVLPDGTLLPTLLDFPLLGDAILDERYSSWKEKRSLHRKVLEVEENRRHHQFLSEQVASHISKDIFTQLPDQLTFTNANFAQGYLMTFTAAPLAAEEENILVRFAKVFEQTYTRFLDLQKAEAQAREAQIESGLEKIRSRSLAMHHSGELKDVVAIMFEKMKELNVVIGTIAIQLFDEKTMSSTFWAGNNLHDEPPKVKLPYDKEVMEEDGYMKDCWECKTKGENLINKEYTFEQKTRFFDYVFASNDLATIREADRAVMRQTFVNLPDGHIICLINEKNSSLFADSWYGEFYSDESIKVLIRAAKVFEQAYVRFLDLQKAEAQARESQIEAALERVRARTMAMHKSEELLDVIVVVSQQLTHLDFRFDVVSFARTSEMHDYRYWFCLENAQLAYEMHVPYLNNPMFERVKSAMTQGAKFLADTLTVAENREWVEHMLAHGAWPDISNEVKDFLLSRGYARSIVFMPQIMLFLGNYFLKPYSDEQNNILKRFAAVFEQSYTRFLDLQKAEAQAREAQIEAALERVRSKAMAMHTAQQLSEVVHELRKQMGQLGQKDLETCVIHLNDESPDFVEAWAASRLPNRSDEIQEFHVMIPKRGLAIVEEALAAYSANRKDYVMINDGAKIDQWMEFMRESVPAAYPLLIESINSSGQDVKKRAYWSFADFQGGSMLMVTLAEPNETSRALLRRFSNVFGLAYRRFADLKQAEAQAREATIETALEKIRSRSLGMHKSEEILDVVAILFEKLKELGLVFDGGAAIHLFSEGSRDATIWVMSPELSRPIVSNLPYDEVVANNPIILDVWKARDTGQHIVNKHYSFDEKKEYFEYVFKHNALVLSNEVKDFIRSANSYTANFIAERNSLLGASSWTGQVFSENDIEVLKRVAHVFEQAYIRFLDLQRAEAQTREANIEAALEKIRSRSLGMHKSEEILDVVAILFEKLKELGLVFDGGAAIHLFSEGSRDATIWVTAPQQGKPVVVNLPYDEADFADNPIIQDVWRARETGESIINKHYPFEQKNRYFHYVFKHNTETPSLEVQKFILDANSYTATFISEKNSLLGANSWTEQKFSDDDVEVLKRVARVFEQAYVRFLDLQRAEAQAREATIEAALEKIRSRSLGMHQSDEIKDVVAIVCEKLKELDLPFDGGAGLYLFPEGSRDIYLWVTNLQLPAPVGVYIPYDENDFSDNSIMQDVWKAKNTGEVIVCKHYSPADKDKLFDYTTKHNAESSLPEEVMRQVAEAKSYTATFIPEKNCLLSVDSWTKLMMSAGDIEILKRVARVFEQAYVRFLDLQKAEVHAKEAVCQASLDRVRAEIASMRTVEDLDRITPLIWRELNTIGIPFIRCGVFIMDEANRVVQSFLSTPDGKAIAVFQLPFDVPGRLGRVAPHWQDKKVFLDYWDEGAMKDVADTLVTAGIFSSPKQYLDTLPRGGFHLHMLPFAQGMLYVANLTRLKDEELNLLQSLADAFATAYARYDDFNKLESAKQQVDRTLVDLKQAQQQLVQSEKMASLGELTAGIAHEIQNPLNFVNNFSEVSNELIDEMKTELQAGNLKDAAELAESIKQNLEKITHHGKRADGIVKGMLQHSRAASGQKEPTDINALCDEYLRLAYHGFRAKDKSFNVKFESDFDKTLPKVNVVSQDIGRVILNLINNAFYAVNERKKLRNEDYDPRVTVTTRTLPDKVEICVKDNGSGIPERVKDKIFQPFFTTKPTGQGTGLGLSLAYDIVNKGHGGELKLQTTNGEGTEFLIQLPIST